MANVLSRTTTAIKIWNARKIFETNSLHTCMHAAGDKSSHKAKVPFRFRLSFL